MMMFAGRPLASRHEEMSWASTSTPIHRPASWSAVTTGGGEMWTGRGEARSLIERPEDVHRSGHGENGRARARDGDGYLTSPAAPGSGADRLVDVKRIGR
jgi:hypothetical protein